MAAEYASLVSSIGGLMLTDNGSDSTRPNLGRAALVKSVRALAQSAEATATHAQQVEPGAPSTQTRPDRDIARLSSLRRRANNLASTTATFIDAAEGYVVAYVSSLAGPGTFARKLLSHFDAELKSIARGVLDRTRDDSNALREMLETCYDQSLQTLGALHSDNYLTPLGEASLASPYDPDFESEEYYDHENRLDVDEGYARAFRVQRERQRKNMRQRSREQQEQWIGFWVHALSQCPDGPTLFYPRASDRPRCKLAHVPRYLFRAFDDGSSGRSDRVLVASAESITATPLRNLLSKVDILSRRGKAAREMLHGHLTKACFGARTRPTT